MAGNSLSHPNFTRQMNLSSNARPGIGEEQGVDMSTCLKWTPVERV